MGRLTFSILTLIGIHLFLYLLTGIDLTSSSWVFALMGFENWAANPIINFMTSTVGMFGTGAVLVVSGYLFRNEFPIYAGVAVAFIGFGMAYVEIYQAFRSQGWLQSGADGTPIFLMLFLAPLIVSWFIVILEFMRGRD
jgi:hypothetical protein